MVTVHYAEVIQIEEIHKAIFTTVRDKGLILIIISWEMAERQGNRQG